MYLYSSVNSSKKWISPEGFPYILLHVLYTSPIVHVYTVSFFCFRAAVPLLLEYRRTCYSALLRACTRSVVHAIRSLKVVGGDGRHKRRLIYFSSLLGPAAGTMKPTSSPAVSTTLCQFGQVPRIARCTHSSYHLTHHQW